MKDVTAEAVVAFVVAFVLVLSILLLVNGGVS